MFDIYGDFEFEKESYSVIECDLSMFKEIWTEVLNNGVIKNINTETKTVELLLQYKDGEYLEYYGYYALISFDYIKKSHIEELEKDFLLFYNKEENVLELKYLKKLNEQEIKEVELESAKMVEFFSKVFDH